MFTVVRAFMSLIIAPPRAEAAMVPARALDRRRARRARRRRGGSSSAASAFKRTRGCERGARAPTARPGGSRDVARGGSGPPRPRRGLRGVLRHGLVRDGARLGHDGGEVRRGEQDIKLLLGGGGLGLGGDVGSGTGAGAAHSESGRRLRGLFHGGGLRGLGGRRGQLSVVLRGRRRRRSSGSAGPTGARRGRRLRARARFRGAAVCGHLRGRTELATRVGGRPCQIRASGIRNEAIRRSNILAVGGGRVVLRASRRFWRAERGRARRERPSGATRATATARANAREKRRPRASVPPVPQAPRPSFRPRSPRRRAPSAGARRAPP